MFRVVQLFLLANTWIFSRKGVFGWDCKGSDIGGLGLVWVAQNVSCTCTPRVRERGVAQQLWLLYKMQATFVALKVSNFS